MSEVAARRYDLDLLRAFAMMLGIGLHTAVATLALPGVSAEGPLAWFAAGVHGFRMPLFFLLSGFFTALLWQRRGARGLLRDRSRRVALPLLVSVVTIIPMLLIFGYLGSLAPVEVSDTGALARNPDLFLGVGLAHMWFLWYLFLLVLAYIPLARAITNSAKVLVWVLPVLAIVPQLFMIERSFGPDTSASIVPVWYVIAYYAVYFTFGAATYDLPRSRGGQRIDYLGRSWPLLLPLSLVILLPIGMYATFIEDNWVAASMLQVMYAWCIIFGLIGLVRALPGLHRPWVRYSSDASYWMYLAHLPLVLLIVPWVAVVGLAWPLTFSVSVLAVTVILLGSYQLFVRYGAIGRLLNGPRIRLAKVPATPDGNEELAAPHTNSPPTE